MTDAERVLLYNLKREVDEMIRGLYGALDKPKNGFIHETQTFLKETHDNVADVKDDIKDVKCILKKVTWLIISVVLLALLKLVIFS